MPAATVIVEDGKALPTQIAVDPVHDLGFSAGGIRQPDGTFDFPQGERAHIAMYDLRAMRPLTPYLRSTQFSNLSGGPGEDVKTFPPVNEWLIDAPNQQMFIRNSDNAAGSSLPFCAETDDRDWGQPQPSLGRSTLFRRLAYSVNEDRDTATMSWHPVIMDCSDGVDGRGDRFQALAASFHSESQHFYFTGNYDRDDRGVSRRITGRPFGLSQNMGDHLVIRQMKFEPFERDERGLDPLVDAAADQTGRGHPEPPPEGFARVSLDWEVDLQAYGCGRRGVQFVGRAGDNVVAYCSDLRAGRNEATGAQGYVVRIPLQRRDGSDRPVIRGNEEVLDPVSGAILNAVVRRTPALPGNVFPSLDPATGTVVLGTADDVNGNAAWVFDPVAERFVGLVTGGVVDQPDGNAALGFDPTRGRLYALTADGLLMARVRARPLPQGQLEPVLVNDNRIGGPAEEGFVSLANGGLTGIQTWLDVARIASAPRLRRLFIPMGHHDQQERCPAGVPAPCPYYAVLQDDIPEPPAAENTDPDALTTQIDEEPGVTTVNANAAALASGVHIVVTGGIPRAADQVSPTCHVPRTGVGAADTNLTQLELERALLGGECLAGRLLTSGHREARHASSTISAGTSAGISAEASSFETPPNDRATHDDIRRGGDCYQTFGQNLGNDVEDFLTPEDSATTTTSTTSTTTPPPSGCDQLQAGLAEVTGDDLRNGTRGGRADDDPEDEASPSPGTGFPVRSAQCHDFGAGSQTPVRDPAPADPAHEELFPAAVTCNLNDLNATAFSAGTGLAAPAADDPVVAVARVSSSVWTGRTDEGQVTEAVASAEGIRVGPLSLARVESRAVTRAKGRTGKAHAGFQRQWCGVRVLDTEISGCVDPETNPEVRQLLDDMNQSFGRVRFTVPPANGNEGRGKSTPGGYQAVVTKDPEVRAGDQAMNDDDSFTVPALQVTFYNDGVEGRSRTVLQFAGVHTESRYGIVELPNFEFEAPSLAFTPESHLTIAPLVRPEQVSRVTVPGREARVVEEIVPAASRARDRPLRRFVRAPLGALGGILRWIINNPREAALLFLVWSLLLAPVYFVMRRRSFEKALYRRQRNAELRRRLALVGLVDGLDPPDEGAKR